MPSSLATSTALITDGIIALPPSKLIGLSSSRKSFCKRPQSQWRERETEKEINRERLRDLHVNDEKSSVLSRICHGQQFAANEGFLLWQWRNRIHTPCMFWGKTFSWWRDESYFSDREVWTRYIINKYWKVCLDTLI